MSRPTPPQDPSRPGPRSDSRVDISTADDINVDEDNAVGSPKQGLTAEAPAGPDIVRQSFERETAPHERGEVRKDVYGRRSMMGAPIDHNAPTNDSSLPPGVRPEDSVEPGRATPGAPPVDNRSGTSRDKSK